MVPFEISPVNRRLVLYVSPYPCIFPQFFFLTSTTLSPVQSLGALPLHPADAVTPLHPRGDPVLASMTALHLELAALLGQPIPSHFGSPACLCDSQAVCLEIGVHKAACCCDGQAGCCLGTCHPASAFICVRAGVLLVHNLMLLSWFIFSVSSCV